MTGRLTQQSEMLTKHDNPQVQRTVLLVDDDAALLEVMGAVLKSLDFKVFVAAGGEEAVALLQEHQDSIECFLIDLSMPDMDGWQTLCALRKIKPHLPAILCSGYDKEKAMEGEHAERPQAFLHKPYGRNDLKNILDQVLSAALGKG